MVCITWLNWYDRTLYSKRSRERYLIKDMFRSRNILYIRVRWSRPWLGLVWTCWMVVPEQVPIQGIYHRLLLRYMYSYGLWIGYHSCFWPFQSFVMACIPWISRHSHLSAWLAYLLLLVVVSIRLGWRIRSCWIFIVACMDISACLCRSLFMVPILYNPLPTLYGHRCLLWYLRMAYPIHLLYQSQCQRQCIANDR